MTRETLTMKWTMRDGQWVRAPFYLTTMPKLADRPAETGKETT